MKLQILAVLMVATFAARAQNTVPPAQKGTEYGAGVNNDKVYDVYSTARLVKALDQKKELENIIVKGKVTGVCPMKGCWVTLETPDKSTVFVKMKDYAFFVPTNMVGKTILLDTKATRRDISVDELKHYAQDAKKPQAEIDAITQPRSEVRLLANGIKVID